MTLIPTASQTVGPFFNFGLTTNHALGIMAPDGAEGEHITLIIRVIDGDGLPTPGDSMIELWQADSQGRYQHPADPRSADADKNFCGFGRLETDRQRRLCLRDCEARPRAQSRRQRAGAAYQRHSLRERPGQAASHARVFCRRIRERGSIRCWL